MVDRVWRRKALDAEPVPDQTCSGQQESGKQIRTEQSNESELGNYYFKSVFEILVLT